MLVDWFVLRLRELVLVCELWGGGSFKASELKRWEEVIVGGLCCCCRMLKMFWLESELVLMELLVGFQRLHIENYILSR